MPATNSITNAEIKTSAYSQQGRKNHDRIFAKKTAIEWAQEEQILTIYGGLFDRGDGITIDTPISFSEFKKRMDLKNTLK
jgi:hypothetical protein